MTPTKKLNRDGQKACEVVFKSLTEVSCQLQKILIEALDVINEFIKQVAVAMSFKRRSWKN